VVPDARRKRHRLSIGEAMKIIASFALVLLVGCNTPAATVPMKTGGDQSIHSGRFVVERHDVFEDPLAYNSRRGIYVIKDTKTGREYVGVSGVGISEVGSHAAGKTRVQDER
jgi:hypothetical protein